MRSPRKSVVEGKSKGPKEELGMCCHSGTGDPGGGACALVSPVTGREPSRACALAGE